MRRQAEEALLERDQLRATEVGGSVWFLVASINGFDLSSSPTAIQSNPKLQLQARRELSRLGVPTSRLKLVFNMVEVGVTVAQAFGPLLAFLKQQPIARVNLNCKLGANEIYGRIKGTKTDLATLATDPTDYKALIAQAKDTTKKVALAQKLAKSLEIELPPNAPLGYQPKPFDADTDPTVPAPAPPPAPSWPTAPGSASARAPHRRCGMPPRPHRCSRGG